MLDKNHGWQHSPSTLKQAYVRQWVRQPTVLDLGCGRGWYSIHLADEGYHVVAVDVERQFSDERIEFRQCSLEDPLPFPNASFDAVLAWDIVEHVENELQLLSEIYRICKPEGILLGSVPNADDKALTRYNLTYQHHKDKSHKREYLLDELVEKLSGVGFRIQKVQLEGPVLPHVLVEFLRWRWLRLPVQKFVSLLVKTHVVWWQGMFADIFFVARKPAL